MIRLRIAGVVTGLVVLVGMATAGVAAGGLSSDVRYYAGYTEEGPGEGEVSFFTENGEFKHSSMYLERVECTNDNGTAARPSGLASFLDDYPLDEDGSFRAFQWLEREKEDRERIFRVIEGAVDGSTASGSLQHTFYLEKRPFGSGEKFCDSGERQWTAEQVSFAEWQEFRHSKPPGTARPAYYTATSRDGSTELSFLARDGKLRRIFADIRRVPCTGASGGKAEPLASVASGFEKLTLRGYGYFDSKRESLGHAGGFRRIRGDAGNRSGQGFVRISVTARDERGGVKHCDTGSREWEAERVTYAEWREFRGIPPETPVERFGRRAP